MPHELIGPSAGEPFLHPHEVITRLAANFDQIVVSRYEAQLTLQSMPPQMRELIEDPDQCYVVSVQHGLRPQPEIPPEQIVSLQVLGKGEIVAVYRDEAHQVAVLPLLEQIEAVLGYGRQG